MNATYETPKEITKEQLEEILGSGDISRICKGLVDAAFSIDDWEWMQRHCLRLTYSDNEWLRKVACICLGHVARIHHKLDVARVLSRMRELQNDPVQMVRGNAEDTIEGIQEVWKPAQTPSSDVDTSD